jgi:hypothetical protein
MHFIYDLENGRYDGHFKELKKIVNHPKKNQLSAINCINFLTLIQTEPTLLAGAFIPSKGKTLSTLTKHCQPLVV